MNRRALVGPLAALALAVCSCTHTDLAGEWAPTSAELGGKDFPVAGFGGASLHLTKDTYEFAGDKGTFAVLSTRPPARMDIHGQVGPNAGHTIQAIYELAGEQLTICYQLGSGDRPSVFDSATGPQVLLVHYKRVQ